MVRPRLAPAAWLLNRCTTVPAAPLTWCLLSHLCATYAGFMYDSSIPEPFPTATSPDGNTRLWPYTMDHGLPQRCDLGTGEAQLPGLRSLPACPR